MKELIHRCPICTKIVSLEKNGNTEKIEPVHGICWQNIGYSLNGWGRRNNFMKDFSGTVCQDCFNALKNKIDELNEAFQERKDSCQEGICTYKKYEDPAARHNVPYLRQNQLQRKRHQTPLLWLLSLFS